jgi:competence protein ComEC
MERPLAAPLISLVAGLSLAGLYPVHPVPAVLPTLLAVAFLTLFLKNRLLFQLSLCLLLFASGSYLLGPCLAPRLGPEHIAAWQSDDPVTVEGVIDSRPEATERGGRLCIRTKEVYQGRQRTLVSGRLLLYVGEGKPDLMTGDRVRFSSRIRKPRNFGIPGEFDFERFLAFKEIFATAFVKTPDEIILIREGVDYRLQRSVDLVAARIGAFIDQSVPRAEGAILKALLIGDMGGVDRATRDAYSRTGVNHILSISGFHVGVIAVFIFQLLMSVAKTSEYLLLRFNLRRFILLLTFPLIVFYLFLSGSAPATVRSVIMIGVYILALVIEREIDPVNSLLLAAAFILALTPAALFDLSFQLSFLAFWGIIVLTPLFAAPFEGATAGIARKLLLLFMASAGATVATFLPVAYYFHRVSATGLISNFFIVPLMGYGAVVAGFAAFPFIPTAPFLAGYLLKAAAYLVRLSNLIIARLDRIPTLPALNPGRSDLLLFFLLFASFTFIPRGRARGLVCGSLLLLLAGSLAWSPQPDAGKLSIHFLSVGQGEATLVRFPDGRNMLVDGGGNAREGAQDVGERLIAPALWKLGVKRLDYLVLSHPHPDHVQGLRFIAATFPVGEYWEGPGPIASRDHAALARVLFEKQVPVRKLDGATPPLDVGGVRIEPLWPLSTCQGHYLRDEAGLNDESLVFRLVHGRFSLLFTGDIGFRTEEALLRAPERLACTVLKVPHHGSRFSSSDAFIAAASPSCALIGAGFRNSFHLPAADTVAAFSGRGIRIFRTDLDGTIRVVSDGSREKTVIEKVYGHFH